MDMSFPAADLFVVKRDTCDVQGLGFGVYWRQTSDAE